jgi:large-conductance mechanosensitive channel
MENIVEKTKDKIRNTLIIFLNFVKNNLSGFLKFLFDKNIIQTSVGIIIASQIGKITNIIVESLINPIVKRLSVGTIDNINNWELNLFDINIKIGLILYTIINFLLVAIVVYHIWKLSQNTNFDYIKDTIENIKDNIDNIDN